MDVNLIMFKNDGTRKDFALSRSKTVIGRGEECALQIPLLSVSRRHCELIRGQTLIVRDLASSNGTFVNNARVNEKELNPGDRLTVGPICFTIQIDGKPAEVKPVKAKPAAKPAAKPVAKAPAKAAINAAGKTSTPAKPAPAAAKKAPAKKDSEESGIAFFDDLDNELAAGKVGDEEVIELEADADPLAALEEMTLDDSQADKKKK
jgi:pSer/pThr/pTyr-binding forkhead associated (FHA) protein